MAMDTTSTAHVPSVPCLNGKYETALRNAMHVLVEALASCRAAEAAIIFTRPAAGISNKHAQ